MKIFETYWSIQCATHFYLMNINVHIKLVLQGLESRKFYTIWTEAKKIINFKLRTLIPLTSLVPFEHTFNQLADFVSVTQCFHLKNIKFSDIDCFRKPNIISINFLSNKANKKTSKTENDLKLPGDWKFEQQSRPSLGI